GPGRFCAALTACIDVGAAVGNGDVGESRPPVSTNETAVRLVAFELIDDLKEGKRLSLAVARLDSELAGIFALPVAHFRYLVERDAEFLGDQELSAGELAAGGAGNLHR